MASSRSDHSDQIGQNSCIVLPRFFPCHPSRHPRVPATHTLGRSLHSQLLEEVGHREWMARNRFHEWSQTTRLVIALERLCCAKHRTGLSLFDQTALELTLFGTTVGSNFPLILLPRHNQRSTKTTLELIRSSGSSKEISRRYDIRSRPLHSQVCLQSSLALSACTLNEDK